MNPAHWKSLIEVLHSSLIDELNEKLPHVKPGLELPQRYSGWVLPPLPKNTEILLTPVSFEQDRLLSVIAVDQDCQKLLPQSLEQFRTALFQRAEQGFRRRHLAPVISDPFYLRSDQSFPSSWGVLSRVVWIPMRIQQGICCLGVGA